MNTFLTSISRINYRNSTVRALLGLIIKKCRRKSNWCQKMVKYLFKIDNKRLTNFNKVSTSQVELPIYKQGVELIPIEIYSMHVSRSFVL